MTKEDKLTGRQTGGGAGGGREELRGGDVPAGALAHEPCCHTKGGSFRVGLNAKTQNPKQVSLNPKAQLPQITSPANLLLDTRTRTNQEGWQSFSL